MEALRESAICAKGSYEEIPTTDGRWTPNPFDPEPLFWRRLVEKNLWFYHCTWDDVRLQLLSACPNGERVYFKDCSCEWKHYRGENIVVLAFPSQRELRDNWGLIDRWASRFPFRDGDHSCVWRYYPPGLQGEREGAAINPSCYRLVVFTKESPQSLLPPDCVDRAQKSFRWVDLSAEQE